MSLRIGEWVSKNVPKPQQNVAALALGAVMGVPFGFLLEKGKVFLPYYIREQMLMRDFTMMSFFFSATAGGLISLALAERLNIEKRSAKNTDISLLGLKYGGNILGGLLIGVGMSLSGACPGTSPAQLAVGVESVKYVLAGAALGTLAFGYLFKSLQSKLGLKAEPEQFLDKKLNISYTAIAAAITAVIAVALYGIESFAPWASGIRKMFPDFVPQAASLSSVAFNPVFAGLLLGLWQLPAVLLTGKNLGASSCYVTATGLLCNVFDQKIAEHAPYFTDHRKFVDWTQLGSLFGVFAGALLSASNGARAPQLAINPAVAFAGGFALLFGARLASGCPSGHGLTGMARLSIGSFVTVAAMFAGGMLTAQLVL